MPTDDRSNELLEDARLRTFAETNAQGVFGNLRDLRGALPVHRRRWIWELLQNAADAAPLQKGNNVEIVVEPGRLRFCHNGVPFDSNQITHLIYHGSTKQGDSSGRIRFGTGFLTIHLVSQKVKVAGVWEGEGEQKAFEFRLNRGGDSYSLLKEQMDLAWSDFLASLQRGGQEKAAFTTIFECEVDSGAETAIREGVADLITTIPYVLGFVSALEEVSLSDGSIKYCWARKRTERNGQHFRSEIVETSAAGTKNLQVVGVGDNLAGAAIAVLLREESNNWHLAVDDVTPRLFYPFPLVETQDFPVPFVVVSNRFEAPETRNGIHLKAPSGEDKSTDTNWSLVRSIPALYESLVLQCAAEGWQARHRLAAFKKPPVRDWLDSKRLIEEVLVPSIAALRAAAAPGMVISAGGRPLPIANASIPIFDDDGGLYALVSDLSELRDRLPLPLIAPDWADILEEWSSILDRAVHSFGEAVTVESLAELIGHKGSLVRLAESIEGGTPEIALNWLNRTIGKVPSESLRAFVQNRTILPNQQGIFKKEGELRLDNGISETIKDVCAHLGDVLRAELLHPQTTPSIHGIFAAQKGKTVGNEECIERALKRIRGPFGDASRQAYTTANVMLLCWLIENGRWDKVTGYPVLCVGDRNELRVGEPLLAPVSLWDSGAQPFAELFPANRRLSDAYTSMGLETHWQPLHAKGVILLSLFVTKPIELIDSEQVDGPLSEETDHRAVGLTTTAQIAFWGGDDGIYEAIRKSRPRARRFLQFLIQYVAKADHSWINMPTVSCSCGQRHSLLPGWLPPVKSNSWVPVRARSLPPSAETLSSILDEELKQLILNDPEHARFLLKMGIGVSDVLRVGASEDKKFQLDQLAARMYASDSETIRSVEAVLTDPDLVETVLSKKLEKERVAKNMKVGTAVESLLRAELVGAGIEVTRRPVGSDFELETDFIENGEEQVLRLSKYLLEVKSTTVDFVRMTLRQGQEATKPENRQGYLLCVVELPGGEISDQAVRDNARFVFNVANLVEAKVAEAQGLKAHESGLAAKGSDAVELDLVQSSVRLRLNSGIWRNEGLTFGAFIDRVKGTP